MGSSIYLNQEVSKVQPGEGFKEPSKAKSEVYEQFLCQQLELIIDHCKQIGKNHAEGKMIEESLEEAPVPKELTESERASQKEKDIIANAPIFYALLYVLFTGENSTYNVLAKKMAEQNAIMKKIGEFTDKIQEFQDKLNELMEGDSDCKKIAEDIANTLKELRELIKSDGSALGDDFIKRLEKFAGMPDGVMDKLVQEATKGACKSWEEAASDPEALKSIKDFLTGADAGALPAPVTNVIQNISNLLGALNTQNQGQLEKLNMTMKKVDAMTKLFASAITMKKGITQTLTNYGGL